MIHSVLISGFKLRVRGPAGRELKLGRESRNLKEKSICVSFIYQRLHLINVFIRIYTDLLALPCTALSSRCPRRSIAIADGLRADFEEIEALPRRLHNSSKVSLCVGNDYAIGWEFIPQDG